MEPEQRRTLAQRWQAFRRGLVEFYIGPYRQTLKREQQDEDDFFTVVVLGEALGIPDPAAFYTAELIPAVWDDFHRSEEHTSELQSRFDLVCRLLLEKKTAHPAKGRNWPGERRF